jgi:hypothetical protein
MEPMDPEKKASILATAFDATEDDVDEYERLLAERFTVDPNMPRVPAPPSAEAEVFGIEADETERPMTRAEIDARLTALRAKLFPGEK